MTQNRKIMALIASGALTGAGMMAFSAPAYAAPLSSPAATSTAPGIDLGQWQWSVDKETAEGRRGYRGRGFGRGYRGRGFRRGYGGFGYRRHRRHSGFGNVLAGLIIGGGLVAIANSASKSRDKRRDEPDRRDQRDNRPQSRNSNSIDLAIDVCADSAERTAGDKARVEDINSVTRDGEGWRVEGTLSGASAQTFQCGVTNARVEFIQLDGKTVASR